MLARMPAGSLLVKLPQARRTFELTQDEVERLITGTLLYARNPIKGGRGVWCVDVEGLIGLLRKREDPTDAAGTWHRLLAQAVNSGRHSEDFVAPPAASAEPPTARADGRGP
jgi:hypothetical protein